ncbi:hypothetical protein LJB92_00530 [Bacteroidales bacterium OttesenSCG-928-M06]|nr:hypothetical protein [Bacteroidales bacterium OttesenSCG-928-M06]
MISIIIIFVLGKGCTSPCPRRITLPACLDEMTFLVISISALFVDIPLSGDFVCGDTNRSTTS